MTHYLKLDLNAITLNPHLARQVPYALSRYYLALPIGRENGSVSVAMAYPDNKKARRILEHLLQAKVVPLLAPAQSIQQALECIHCPEQPQNHAITPIFLARGEHLSMKRILMVMRGFASDEQVLDWLTPFAWSQQAAVTLMPLSNSATLHLNEYLYQDSPPRQHLERCLHLLEREGVPVNLKFRQGDAVQQVVEETIHSTYDLLVMTAEAEGSFVNEVITAVDQHHAHIGRPIVVLKPPELPRQPTSLFLQEGDLTT
jgi:hypothetical protein